jgi:segregation and condensation protein B
MGPPAKKVVEAILFLAEEPVAARHIGEVLERPRSEIEDLLRDLAREYEDADRGYVLREVAGGWRLYTSPECAPWLERFARGSGHGRLTSATLEVLAIVAYKGPLSRAQIAEIRGVDSDGVVRTLIARGLVRESGKEAAPGAPALLSVTSEFLERMGLRGLGDLPPLRTFMPDTEAVVEMESKLSPGL